MTFQPGRRAFLQSLSATVAAPLMGQLFALEKGFARELETLSPGQGALPDSQELERRYLLDPVVTYLNHASIGTVPRPVHAAGMRYREICEENPWLYIWGGAWEEPREEVRGQAAALLGCEPDEVAITHNTTEGFNLFAQGLPLGPGDEVLYSTLNHAGASVCWDHMSSIRGYSVRTFEFPLADVPEMSMDDVVRIHEEQIRDETRVLVFPHLDNIVGLRHPMEALAAAARSRGVEFVLVDGAQTAGMIPIRLARSGIDGFSTSPHKWIQSPKGLGLLYVARAIQDRLRPMWVTWGQARWESSARKYEDYGTRDLPEVLSLGDALTFQTALGEARKEERYREMFDRLRDAVEASPNLTWRSPKQWESGGMLTAVQLRRSGASQVADGLFQEEGIIVRGFPQPDLNSLRISPNLMNGQDQLGRVLALLEQAERQS